ncbi:MAG TPA: alginate lyase family protein, partial [Burkholderiaceae bacterium]|nr:alginate lyase family protein [Burkholderiaceae bacterium]
PTPTPTPTSGLRHPGILVNQEQLDFLKANIAVSAQPWKAAFDKASVDSAGKLNYVAKPWKTVECGSSSNPNFGCSDERDDAIAAYTQALLWYFTGNAAHAKKSIDIMNAWSTTLTGGHTNSNATLQAAWTAEVWPRAAEIIKYTYNGWPQSDQDRFKTMLKNQYLPFIDSGAPCKNGNWEASTIEAMMNIAIFTDDKTLFDKSVAMWRKRTPAYFYLKSDGVYPADPPGCTKDDSPTGIVHYWQDQNTFVDGLAQETCRDFGHTGFGFAAIVNAAETARIQGIDLYAEVETRLTKTMEFHAQYENGTPPPKWLCGGNLTLGMGGTLEIAYNHYHNRLGYALPQTLKVILRQRPTDANYHIDWETLTHADVGAVGIH